MSKEAKQIANLSDLTEDNHNANKGTPRGKEMIESSLRRVGAGRSIVVDKDGRIIAGNKTAEQWASIADSGDIQVIQTDGSKLVVVQRTDLDLADTNSTTARELAYYDNRASEVSLMWDAEVVLADLATDIPMKDIFQDGELDELIKSLGYEDPTTPGADTEPDTSRADELQAEWGTELGQLWQCGPHRLIIGDCTDAEVVSRLMDGDRAEMCFTSPPYADIRTYDGQANLSIEHLVTFIGVAQRFTDYVVVNLGMKREKGKVVRYWDKYIDYAEGIGLDLLSWNVWYRSDGGGSIGNITAMFSILHEWIFVFGKSEKEINRTVKNKHGGKKFQATIRNNDGNMGAKKVGNVAEFGKMGTVFEHSTAKGENDHPAVFPIGFPEEYIKAMTNELDIVYEPFLGSGTTMIAAHNLNRKCYGCEISPAYGGVILQRFKDHTGIEPELM